MAGARRATTPAAAVPQPRSIRTAGLRAAKPQVRRPRIHEEQAVAPMPPVYPIGTIAVVTSLKFPVPSGLDVGRAASFGSVHGAGSATQPENADGAIC